MDSPSLTQNLTRSADKHNRRNKARQGQSKAKAKAHEIESEGEKEIEEIRKQKNFIPTGSFQLSI
jgi:hypothetical protein